MLPITVEEGTKLNINRLFFHWLILTLIVMPTISFCALMPIVLSISESADSDTLSSILSYGILVMIPVLPFIFVFVRGRRQARSSRWSITFAEEDISMQNDQSAEKRSFTWDQVTDIFYSGAKVKSWGDLGLEGAAESPALIWKAALIFGKKAERHYLETSFKVSSEIEIYRFENILGESRTKMPELFDAIAPIWSKIVLNKIKAGQEVEFGEFFLSSTGIRKKKTQMEWDKIKLADDPRMNSLVIQGFAHLPVHPLGLAFRSIHWGMTYKEDEG